MAPAKIVCTNCGYTREIPASALPQRNAKATCPKCKNVFIFDPADIAKPYTPANKTQQSPPKPETHHISLKGGLDAKSNKLLFTLFLILILITVGVRLWADARYKAVPYPNLMAASADGVAVACGQAVYLYGPDGKLLRTYPLPADVLPTQIYWDRGAITVADMRSKTQLVLGQQANQKNGFSGATISAQFKVVREPGTGRLFVSDSGSHRILVFDQAGKYQQSFGKEGKEPGEFRFPNELVFDETGQLLVANTKRPAIEVYSPDGRFISTLIDPAGDRTFRFPTDFVLTPDRLLVLENDGFLERAKVRVYDRKGLKLQELALGDVTLIGDMVTDGQRLYLTDCEGRQLLAFSLADLHPLGSFSRDFAEKCSAWDREAKMFKQLSVRSLAALFAFCAPVIFFYLRIKRDEAKEISQVDLNRLASRKAGAGFGPPAADLILGTPVNARLLKVSLTLLGISILSIFASAILAKSSLPHSFNLSLLLLAMIGLLAGVVFLIRAGGITNWKRKQTEAAFKRIVRDGMLEMLPDESVERVALAQHSQSANDLALLVFTGRRLLLYYINWNRVSKIEQIPFEAILQVKPPSGRSLKVIQSMQVTLVISGRNQELKFYFQKADFLLLLTAEFSNRIGKASGLSHAILCLTCRQPLQDDYCAACATKLRIARQCGCRFCSPALVKCEMESFRKDLCSPFWRLSFCLLDISGSKGGFLKELI